MITSRSLDALEPSTRQMAATAAFYNEVVRYGLDIPERREP